MDNRKICIAIPTNRTFKPQTVLSLARMIAYSKNLDLFISIPTEGFNTAENRNFSVAQAIKNDCSHILFSDDDMAYEPDTLERLLAYDNKDIIGCLYNIRRLPPAFVIGYSKDGIKSDEEAKQQTQPFRCEALGTGMLLVKTEVFKKLESPFFGYKWYDNGMVKISTDWFFCEKAREAGIEIWCDPTIKINHIGDFLY